MKTLFYLLTMTTIIALASCGNASEQSNSDSADSLAENSENPEEVEAKEIVMNGMNAFFRDYSEEGIKTYYAEDYIQHNPNVPTGIEPVLGFLPALKEANVTFKNHRILQDGDMVVMHNTYDNAEAFGSKEIVTFDVFRVENGKIAEHWDAISPIIKETASGRSQFDGPTEVTDLDKTEENKAFIQNFLDDVMFGKNPEKITDYISTEQYDQHNVAVEDGLEGLNKAIEQLSAEDNMFVYKKVHKVLGEGNFVLSMTEGEWNGKNQAFYDLYRIENGKIVEHWDIIQEIPEEMAHENGKF